MPFEVQLLVVSVLLLLGVVASKAASRLGAPALLAFIAVGMLAGSDGPGGLHFDDPALAQNLGFLALALILFAGGMETDWPTVRPVLAPALSLSTVGTLITAGVVGYGAHLILGFRPLEGLLLGSILAATDAAAVFGILRGPSRSVRSDVQGLLELESGSNDPTAVFLTIGLTQALTRPAATFGQLLPQFLLEMALGVAIGAILGRAGVLLMRRLRLEQEAMYSVLSTSLALLAFALPSVVHGNGFLSVYVAGLVFGNGRFHHRRSLARFHDGLAWLMQIAMFVVLGLLVFPSRLPAVIVPGTLIAVVLMLIARPLGTLVSLAPFRFDVRAQGLVAWAGLRGAVPIILATYPRLAGYPKAGLIFDVVFYVVLVTGLVQGLTLPYMANRLGLMRTVSGRAPDLRRDAAPCDG